jgi:hypothetical protein
MGSGVFRLPIISDAKEWGLDPEFAAGRFLYYPQISAYSIGLNLVF